MGLKKTFSWGMIDEIRGFAVLLMVLYHFLMAVEQVFLVSFGFLQSVPIEILQIFFAALFIWISGLVATLSRSALKRGLFYIALGIIISLVTYKFMPQMTIYFGIIHFLGVAMVIYYPLRGLIFRKASRGLALVLIICFCFIYPVFKGYLGFLIFKIIDLPAGLYTTPYLFILGFPHYGFSSGDYVPLLPWIFVFMAGAVWGSAEKRRGFFTATNIERKPQKSRILFWLGRHSLIIYLVHQPLFLFVLSVLRSVIIG